MAHDVLATRLGQRSRRLLIALVALLGALVIAATSTPARAGCGCDKPPPPRAAIRPFFGYRDQVVTLFDRQLRPGRKYDVRFTSSIDGTVDSKSGTVVRMRDVADGRRRVQLRVGVGSLPLGPCTISVWRKKRLLYTLDDDQFTVVGPPLPLHEYEESVPVDSYRAAIGKDGTVYFTVDVSQVSAATTFRGAAKGFPLRFKADHVAMYNVQGYLMQLLDPNVPGLFRITAGDSATSNALVYWRHEFYTYKREHQEVDARHLNRADPNWHNDGTRHVDHDVIVVAVRGTLNQDVLPTPGATLPFQWKVKSTKRSVDEVARDRDDDDDDGDDHDGRDGKHDDDLVAPTEP